MTYRPALIKAMGAGKTTGPLGKEVLELDGVMAIARRYELFNGALQIPQFTSEDEVLSAGASTIIRAFRYMYIMLETSRH